MLSCSASIKINATQDEVWHKLAEFHEYPNWSSCFSFVKNASPNAMSFVDSQVVFHMVRFQDRVKRTATIKEFTSPYIMSFAFARPHAFWLQEAWVITLQSLSENKTAVNIEIDYSGWTHVKTYQEESLVTQTFCEAHLEALKNTLEELDSEADDDFSLDAFLGDEL